MKWLEFQRDDSREVLWAKEKLADLLAYRYSGDEANIEHLEITCHTMEEWWAIRQVIQSGPLVGSLPHSDYFTFEFTRIQMSDDLIRDRRRHFIEMQARQQPWEVA